MQKTINRDWRIELLRFIATMGIAFFHLEWVYYGNPIYFRHFYIFVEFFFVLSGFFLAKNITKFNNKKEFSSIEYTYNQAKKLYLPYFLGFFFSFFLYCSNNDISNVVDILELLWKAKWELLYLHLSGIDASAPIINGVTAYIPALLIASLILHYLMLHHRVMMINIIVPLLPIAVYSHILNIYGNVSQWYAYENWYTVGVIRALAGMCVGIMAYAFGERKNCRKGLGYFLAAVSILAIIALIPFTDKITYCDEIVYPYVFGILLGSIYQIKSKYQIGIVKSIINYLGKISYSIFVTHYGTCLLIKKWDLPFNYFMVAVIYAIAVLIVGISASILTDVLRYMLKKI